MRGGEVEPRPGHGLEGSVAVELGSVVCRDRVHRVRLALEQLGRAPVHFGGGAGGSEEFYPGPFTSVRWTSKAASLGLWCLLFRTALPRLHAPVKAEELATG